MTAPAFWRRPPEDPASANDYVAAGTDVQDQSAFDAPSSSDTGIYIAGTVQIVAVDVVNPPAPASPIGTGGVNFSFLMQAQTTISTIGAGWAQIDPACGINRSYLLADDTTGSGPPVTVVEEFSIHLEPDDFTIGNNVLFVTPNFQLSAQGGGTNTFAGVTINGVPAVPGYSGTTAGSYSGGSVNYSLSADSRTIEITATAPVGTLDHAVRGPDGTISGIGWTVTGNFAMNVGGPPFQGMTSQCFMQGDYSASFA